MYRPGPVRGFTGCHPRRGATHGAFAFLLACGVATAVRAAPPAAGAPPAASPVAAAVVEGHVLAIEQGDVIVDLAAKDGVAVGDVLELWRPLKLVHPVTHRVVMDRYRIGELSLTQVRPTVALGRITGPTLRVPAPGDIVVIQRAPAAAAPVAAPAFTAPPAAPSFAPPAAVPGPAAERPPSGAPAEGPPSDPEAHAVWVLFNGLRGASLTTRIRRYERYAQTHEGGRFSRTLLEEAAALRELVAVRERETSTVPTARHFDAPSSTIDQTPLTLAIELQGDAIGAVLHARNAGEVAYRPMPMTPAGPGYFTATLPAERVVAPSLEYFIEATRPSGQSVAVVGYGEKPLPVTVFEVPHATPPLRHDSTITLVTDYADYNRLRGNDRAWQTEGTFAMRFGDIGVRALRSGFGVYRGVGGSVDELDGLNGRTKVDPRRVGLTYGTHEGEFGIKPAVSVIVEFILGLREAGTAGGGQLHLRIGSDLSTNLSLGGEVLGGVGLRGITQLQIEPLGRFPVLIRSEVTNQPAGAGSSPCGPVFTRAGPATPPPGSVSVCDGDVGARGIVQVGYRFVDGLVVSLRGSYQGRTISHAGPGLGGAVEYRW
jgi:hypothetical protein